MYGAILGDIIGSPFEFDRGDKTKKFDLFSEGCGFTDDSVMTIAVGEALLAVGPEAAVKEIEDAVVFNMGHTLYLGSLKSDVYFCIYEKDYEQYVKLGTPLEEADIINRFEIRLRNERAYYAVRDLLTYYDAEQTAFSIINQYVRFVDEEPDKRKNDWKLNDRWAWFIGDNRQSLKLTTKPEPYTLDRTLRWVQRQVAPTLKMLKKIDKGNGTDYMETIEQQAKLTEKHEMIIKQQTTPAKDLVES